MEIHSAYTLLCFVLVTLFPAHPVFLTRGFVLISAPANTS